MKTLASLVEDVKHLSLEEMEELQHLAEHYKIEKRRGQFQASHAESLQEYGEGKLSFASDINKLRESLDL